MLALASRRHTRQEASMAITWGATLLTWAFIALVVCLLAWAGTHLLRRRR